MLKSSPPARVLLGEIVDTNAAWMARRLRDPGINLFYKTTVGDNLYRIAAVMRQGLDALTWCWSRAAWALPLMI